MRSTWSTWRLFRRTPRLCYFPRMICFDVAVRRFTCDYFWTMTLISSQINIKLNAKQRCQFNIIFFCANAACIRISRVILSSGRRTSMLALTHSDDSRIFSFRFCIIHFEIPRNLAQQWLWGISQIFALSLDFWRGCLQWDYSRNASFTLKLFSMDK